MEAKRAKNNNLYNKNKVFRILSVVFTPPILVLPTFLEMGGHRTVFGCKLGCIKGITDNFSLSCHLSSMIAVLLSLHLFQTFFADGKNKKLKILMCAGWISDLMGNIDQKGQKQQTLLVKTFEGEESALCFYLKRYACQIYIFLNYTMYVHSEAGRRIIYLPKLRQVWSTATCIDS